MKSFTYKNERDKDFYESYEIERTPNRRVQDKIIAIIGREDIDILREREVQLEENERDEFIAQLRSGAISREQIISVLDSIPPPQRWKTNQEIFKDICDYPNFNLIKGLIKISLDETYIETGEVYPENIKGYENINSDNLKILTEKYPDPMSLDLQLREFLSYIESNAGGDLMESYNNAKRVMLGLVYGKKYEYWAQIRLLALEALSNTPNETLTMHKLTLKASVPKVLPDNEISQEEKRKYDAENNKKIYPMLQSIVQEKHEVPYVLEDSENLYILSIPEKPNISDEEAREIYFELAGQILEHKPYIKLPMTDMVRLKRELAKILQPQTYKDYPGLHTEEGFQTKNAIYRVFLANNKINEA